jgi:hypothetical protein
LKEKTFGKESDPTYGTRITPSRDVDGVPHFRKDLQLVRGAVIPSKKPNAAQIKADKVGKAAYNPVLKQSTGSSPRREQVETMINEPMKQRGKQIDCLHAK